MYCQCGNLGSIKGLDYETKLGYVPCPFHLSKIRQEEQGSARAAVTERLPAAVIARQAADAIRAAETNGTAANVDRISAEPKNVAKLNDLFGGENAKTPPKRRVPLAVKKKKPKKRSLITKEYTLESFHPRRLNER